MGAMIWRQMSRADLPALMAVQEEAYPWHQEKLSVFEDRLALWPQGCLVLGDGHQVGGYILSHPWHADSPPALDSRLGALPRRPGTYYLHDLALLKSTHGKGQAARIVRHMAETAGSSGFTSMSLIAVNGSAPFWERHGFSEEADPSLALKLESYGTDSVFMKKELR